MISLITGLLGMALITYRYKQIVQAIPCRTVCFYKITSPPQLLVYASEVYVLLLHAMWLIHSTQASSRIWLEVPVQLRDPVSMTWFAYEQHWTYIKEIIANDDDRISTFSPSFTRWNSFYARRCHRKRRINTCWFEEIFDIRNQRLNEKLFA